MSFETILFDTDARGIATLTFNRPDKHHALSEPMMREITAACDAVEADPALRALVLRAEGKSFCAGGDLGWMREQAALDRAGKMEGAGVLARMLRRLDELPVPVIARVQGHAFGGGIGMMAVADIVIAATAATFALTETRLGLIPATIGPYVVRRIGEGHARRIFLNGRRFGTEEALRMGLVSRVVPPEGLDAAIEDEIAALVDCAPGAVAHAKRLVRMLARGETDDPIGASMEALADRWESDEATGRIARFLGQA